MSHGARTGVLLVLVAAVLWGTTGTAQSLARPELSSVWIGAFRLLAATVFFATYVLIASAPVREAARSATPAGIGPAAGVLVAGFCMAAYNLAFFAGVRATGVAVGTAIALGSGPLWTGILQAVVTHRPPSSAWWVGTLMAVVGGGLLVTGGPGDGPGLSTSGIVLCLLAGLSYAVYTLVNQRLVASLSAAWATSLVFAVAAALAVPAAAWLAGAPSVRLKDAAIIVYLGIVTTGIAYLLFSHALRRISASTAVTLALGEPVTAFVLAILVVGERPAALAIAGLLLVIAGVAVVIRAELLPDRRVQATG